jgi:hypothetical protein
MAASTVTAVVSFFLLAGSWDGLYDTLDLPQALPALTTQLGGLGLAALAYLMWSAETNPALQRPVGTAGVIFLGGGAIVIALWLIFRDPRPDLGIDTLGTVILSSVAAVSALVALALAKPTLGKVDQPAP